MQTHSTMTAYRKMANDHAEDLALRTLTYIVADEERLGRFLAVTGLQPDSIRSAAASPGFLAAVLDYVAGDEPLLIALAQSLALKPERIMEARWTLSPSEFD
jgi:secreted protein with Ig-like and vWFA domain